MLLACAELSTAQHGMIGDFRASQVNDYVMLAFTINAGNQCSDMAIERSVDSVNFQTLFTIPGVCGNASSDATYYHSDAAPYKNIKNYYRLRIGFLGFSEIISVKFFAPDKNGYLLVPDCDGGATLLFSNINYEPYTFELFGMDGRLKQITTGINGSSLTIPKNNSAPGIHIFRLKNESGKIITGKIIFN